MSIQSALPKHVAIIMDGNGRWAKKRLMPRYAGHKVGEERVRDIVRCAGECKIQALTLFAFSSENWKRPRIEVGMLMDLFLSVLEREVKNLHKNNVKLRVIGDRAVLSKALQEHIRNGENLTRNNTGLNLVVAANYGGHWDIAQAAKQVAEKVRAGSLSVDEVTPQALQQHVCLADLPPPDLFIRTGGEQRISNFLLWQLAYSELYFTDVLWPDFNCDEFDKALVWFSTRQRRFGLTGEQVEKNA